MVTESQAGFKSDLAHQVHRFTFVLSRRKWWALLTFVAILGAVTLYTRHRRPVYRATASVIIEASPPRVLAGVKEVVELGSTNYWIAREYFQTQQKVIAGLEVASRVVEKLRLDEDPEFLGLPPGKPVDEKERLRRIANKVPARILQERITVEPVRDSTLVTVSVDDHDPQRAAEIVNEVVFAYRDQNIDYRRAVLDEANSELAKMVERYRREKEEADQKLLEFERAHNVGSFQASKEALQAWVKTLHDRRGELELKKSELEARRARVRRLMAAGNWFSVPLESVLTSSLLIGLKSRLVELRDQRTGLAVTYGEKHPKILALEEQIREMEATLKSEVRAHLAQAEGDYQEVVSSLAEVEALLRQAETDLSEMGALELDYNTLLERKNTSTDVYKQVHDRFMETTLSAQVETNNVRIQELARVPERPIRPDLRLAVAVGGLVGILLGVGLAFLMETLDNTVKGREDAERLVGAPCLGVIPSIPGAHKGNRGPREEDPGVIERDFYPLHKPKSQVSEALNTIRTNLLFVLPDRKIRTIVVSSANPREGKSTVVTMLGITLARFGSRTVLVEADLRRPRLYRTFGIEANAGLSSLLVGDGVPLESTVQPTSVPNLDVLPCGPVPPNPSDLLSTPRFEAILKDLQSRYDTVILDSPPVIPVADPRIISGVVDGLVLVVKVGRTTNESLVQVRRELAAVSARTLGVILNDLDVRRRGYEYGYGYGYGGYYGDRHGYYTRDEDEQPAAASKS